MTHICPSKHLRFLLAVYFTCLRQLTDVSEAIFNYVEMEVNLIKIFLLNESVDGLVNPLYDSIRLTASQIFLPVFYFQGSAITVVCVDQAENRKNHRL